MKKIFHCHQYAKKCELNKMLWLALHILILIPNVNVIAEKCASYFAVKKWITKKKKKEVNNKSLKTGHFMYLSYLTLKTFSKQMIRNVAEEFMFKLLFEVIFIIARTT